MLYFVPFIEKHIWIGSEMNVFCTNLNFLTFKVAKEEDVRDYFQVIILPSFLCEPLCKLLNSCANTETLFTVLGMLTCGLLFKQNGGYDGIMQHDGKQSFGRVHTERTLWTSPITSICYILCGKILYCWLP